MYFKPSYLPYNDAAKDSVETLAEALGLSLNIKYQLVLASFLAVAKAAKEQSFYWLSGHENRTLQYYSHYPNVGAPVITKVRKKLLECGFILDAHKVRIKEMKTERYTVGKKVLDGVELSELMGFGVIENQRYKSTNSYFVPLEMLPKTLDDAAFIDANNPYLLVNHLQTWEEKQHQEREGLPTPRLRYKETLATFKLDYSKAVRPVKEMNAYWQQHPLYNPIQNEYYAAATRIFHNASIKSGGRWYGNWTNKSATERLNFTIDGDAVCEVDINASHPTLLSCLVSERMNIGETWTDLYHSLAVTLPHIENARGKIKKVFLELIGTGNPNKREPSVDAKGNSLDKEEYLFIRDAALEMYPCLKHLNKERMNFANALSFHEAEILTTVLLQLKLLGVAAYPIHDCVLVKEEHQTLAVETLRRVFTDYIYSYQKRNKLPYLNINLAVSIESNTSSKVRLFGSYL